MCIAIYSLSGNSVPTDTVLKTCFQNNSDGAGFAFNLDNHQVQIVKGFMTYDKFIKAFRQYDRRYCFKDRGVLIHFRIATHGGINKGCCHPFPISNKDCDLKKTSLTSSYAVIHNGIISLTSAEANRKKILSDTMVFIQKYLFDIATNKHWFKNQTNFELIENLINSKMAVLNGYGEIRSTSGFHKGADGNYYSNDSYQNDYYYHK